MTHYKLCKKGNKKIDEGWGNVILMRVKKDQCIEQSVGFYQIFTIITKDCM